MPFCPNCGKEVSDRAVFCPACGGKLAESEVRLIVGIKRPASMTATAILLFIYALIHFVNLVDFIIIYDLVGSIGQLFMFIISLVAGFYLLKSKEIGGILGLASAIFAMIADLILLGLSPELALVYGLIIDFCLSIAVITLLVTGWKHLKYPK